ncbi:BspA family leucine-rich repeat surface protein [Bifidobacterium sp. ESL0790]|uniref:BspA family leucine-rich repeat surface protein n=1 Tax=Bifidobacterium sp. ESL0790 TaxID=2983233 RepID=UPI0023F7B3DE|nr:BspA family leucine-rich repeat surface protein [Bifidobacterium sp. ESL0790]WEV72204.1 BspA family leucine-rich repeat surface protein [Bifidobacterium sp. ESL0790]
MNRSNPSAGPQSATCNQPGDHTWGTLTWNEHVNGNDCVLELEYGTIPDTGTTGDSTSSHIPWKDPGVSKLVVDAPAGNGSVKLTSGYGIFDTYFLPGLRTADVTHLDTSTSTNMGYMFHDQANLTEVTGLGQWDTSLVTNMSYMFRNCPKLTDLDIEGWQTGAVTTFASMLQGDTALVGKPDHGGESTPNGHTLDLSRWSVAQATDMTYLLYGCSSLESLDISGWDLRGDERSGKTRAIMAGCTNLHRIKVGPNMRFTAISHRRDSGWGDYWDVDRGGLFHDWTFARCPDDPTHGYYQTVCAVKTPVYMSRDYATYIRGFDIATAAQPTGTTWVYLVPATYDASGGNISSCHDAVPGTPACSTATKAQSRLNGWKDGDGGKHAPGWTIPWTVPGKKLTAQWQTIKPPGVSKATPHTDGTLTIHGTFPGGTLDGDQFTAYPYATQTGGAHGTASQSEKTTSATATAPEDADWEADYTTAANPYPKDKIGTGVSWWFTSTLTQKDNTTSAESSPRTKLTIDTVAPGLQSHVGGRVPTSAPGVKASIKGMVRTSGDSVAQPDNTIEAGDRITITWPDGSTSGADGDGNPLPSGSNGSIVSGADGSFAEDVPSTVALDGREATVKVYDNADGDGTDPDHPAGVENKANTTSVTVKLVTPTVNKLPLTGQHWQADNLILLAAVTVLTIITTAYAQHRRSRH